MSRLIIKIGIALILLMVIYTIYGLHRYFNDLRVPVPREIGELFLEGVR